MTAGPGPLLVQERDDRVIVTLNRPAVRNAIDLATVDALHQVCALLEATPRPLLLTGSDGVFAAGADIRQLRDRRREEALAAINRRRSARLSWSTFFWIMPRTDSGSSRWRSGTASASNQVPWSETITLRSRR